MQRHEARVRKKIKEYFYSIAITQSVIAVIWVSLYPQLLNMEFIQEQEWALPLATLLGMPVIAFFFIWRFSVYTRSGWKRKAVKSIYDGEWYFEAKVISTYRVGPNNDIAIGDKTHDFCGTIHIDQTPVSIRVRSGKSYNLNDTNPAAIWKSTACRLSEDGDQIRLAYVCNRTASGEKDCPHSDEGYMFLSIEATRGGIGTEPVILYGSFHDCMQNGKTACRGDIRMYKQSTAKTATKKKTYRGPAEPKDINSVMVEVKPNGKIVNK